MRASLIITTLLFSLSVHASSIEELLPKAESNDIEAQYNLARLYQHQGDAMEEAIYWFLQAAEQHHPPSSLALANIYIKGMGTNQDIPEAIYWLTEQALRGNIQAQIALGTLYENMPAMPSTIDMAEVWYRLASNRSDRAENDYSRILERQFNQQRAKQVASIDQLDDVIDGQRFDLGIDDRSPQSVNQNLNQTPFYILTGVVALLILVSVFLGFSTQRWKKKYQVALSGNSHLEKKEVKIQEQATTIKQQKRQLETLFRQFKKLQAAATSKTPAKPAENKLSLACAMFGFSANRIPDEKVIKARFKQLSKIYHPDMKGSEEEMKRLNQALKIILHHVNK